ncbi:MULTISPECIES: TIGR03668 family PPOX class F420-dependent oxidoreductase [unclassified Streptomyces]|uniref:TIGR03668 family PPOX class F420-dependent oxidoreductase n=1 Tax=unclassified Streptomyces TaxID=2593676 RepID=UPI002255691E|nr:TIGR03668 family PPOX class F420-dependent oxidoreductase [Streptomyces sp. NBC_00198]MCX5280578.1 TIGR03668 family PPOX class F420-dependent oxidoreductase [Streptomyces sp. NBC_00198]
MPDMDEDEARRRFLAARVARLATVDAEGRPHLVPLVFAGCGGGLVSAVDHKPKRSPLLRRLRNIAVHPGVCLLVDRYDEEWERLWWVRVEGDARVVAPEDAEIHPAAVGALREKYPQYRDRPPDGPVIAITVHRWRGWQATGAA